VLKNVSTRVRIVMKINAYNAQETLLLTMEYANPILFVEETDVLFANLVLLEI
jgi:hypothetical protein